MQPENQYVAALNTIAIAVKNDCIDFGFQGTRSQIDKRNLRYCLEDRSGYDNDLDRIVVAYNLIFRILYPK